MLPAALNWAFIRLVRRLSRIGYRVKSFDIFYLSSCTLAAPTTLAIAAVIAAIATS